MKQDTYGGFSARVHQSLASRGPAPTHGTMELTHRCNLNCVHCYNNLPVADRAAIASEMTLEQHHRLIDQMHHAGCLWLLYTGGEIFVRRDFRELYGYAHERGFLITLFTNGVGLTPGLADFLVAHRPFQIEITLYGFSTEVYEAVTRVPGSRARCYRAVDLLLDRGLPLALKTIALSANRQELQKMRAYAAERGLGLKFDALVNARTDCSGAPLEHRLAPQEVVALDMEDESRRASWREYFERHPLAPTEAPATRYQCGAGKNAFAVGPDGHASLCVLSQEDRFEGDFKSQWASLRTVREQPRTTDSKCDRCAMRALCGMCPAQGQLEHGEPEGPVDFLCHVAHLRALAFGHDVPEHGTCHYCTEEGRSQLVGELAMFETSPDSGVGATIVTHGGMSP